MASYWHQPLTVVSRTACHLTAIVVNCCTRTAILGNLLFTIIVHCVYDAKVKQEADQLLFALRYRDIHYSFHGSITV